jgi:hypothetical protein
MKFKIGDIVRARDISGSHLSKQSLYRVNSISSCKNYVKVLEVMRNGKDSKYSIGEYFASRFELAIPDTKLNRVLYPELTSNGRGFLS